MGSKIECDIWRDENNLYIKIGRQRGVHMHFELTDSDGKRILISGPVNNYLDQDDTGVLKT
jgi:hypothetical protein